MINLVDHFLLAGGVFALWIHPDSWSDPVLSTTGQWQATNLDQRVNNFDQPGQSKVSDLLVKRTSTLHMNPWSSAKHWKCGNQY
jgi:hypothetical protein